MNNQLIGTPLLNENFNRSAETLSNGSSDSGSDNNSKKKRKKKSKSENGDEVNPITAKIQQTSKRGF